MQFPIRAAVLVCALAAAPQALAQQTPPPNCPNARTGGGTMSEGTYRVVEKAIEDLAKNRYGDAERRLRELSERTRDYERAIVFQTLGFVYAQQNNMRSALQAFEEALKQNSLPQAPYENLLYNVGQIYFAEGQYDTAIAKLEQYFREACNPPSADAHIQLAAAYSEKKRFRDAISQVDQAIAKSRAPKENWLQLKLALHYELKEFAKCAEVLVLLIGLVPAKEDYWKQLSGVLFEIQKDKDSLAVLALAERQGFMTKESDYKNLFNVYMLLEIPYKAAEMWSGAMERGVVERNGRNYELLSDAWIAAREYSKAEAALKKTAEISNNGDTWKRLGEVYIQDERWADAIGALERALRQGTTKPGETNFLIGHAAFSAGDKRRAEAALTQAARYPDSANEARQLLSYIRSEEPPAPAPAAPAEGEAPAAPATPEAPTPPAPPAPPAPPPR